jgi:O-antigen ligase
MFNLINNYNVFNQFKKKKNKNFYFYYLPSVLISLFPVLIITGPFLSDLVLCIICIVFIIKCFLYKDYSYFKNLFFYFFIIFYIGILISSITSNNVIFSLKTSFFYFRFGLFALALWYFLNLNKNLNRYFFSSLFICILILGIDSFFQHAFNFNLLGKKISETSRVSSFFGDELIMGGYLAKMLPIFLGLFFFNKKIFSFAKKSQKVFQTIFYIIYFLGGATIILSGERSSFFLFFLFNILLFFFFRKKDILKIIYIIIFFLLFLCLLIFSNSKIANRLINVTKIQFQTGFDQKKIYPEDDYFFSSYVPYQYKELYGTAYKIFIHNKFLGAGPKSFRIECKNELYFINEKSCSTHPHNYYLQLLAETGLIGFFLIFIVFIISLVIIFLQLSIFKKIKKYLDSFSVFQLIFLSSISINLWPFITTGNFFNNLNSMYIYISFSFFLWSYYKIVQK